MHELLWCYNYRFCPWMLKLATAASICLLDSMVEWEWNKNWEIWNKSLPFSKVWKKVDGCVLCRWRGLLLIPFHSNHPITVVVIGGSRVWENYFQSLNNRWQVAAARGTISNYGSSKDPRLKAAGLTEISNQSIRFIFLYFNYKLGWF